MNICYQCGEEMVTEEFYTQNQAQFTSKPKLNHYEHIIQNALFGKLKPHNILCKQCGSDASNDIDKGFVSLFQIITETVRHILIRKDHGKDSVNTMKGVLYDKQDENKKRDVQIRENVVAPKDPFYEYDEANNKVVIYATKIRAKQYEHVVKKELKDKGFNDQDLKIDIIEDISDMGLLGIYFSEGVENFNQKFTMGFCKIAVGFATYCNIPREQLTKALSIGTDGKGSLVSSHNIFPYVAIGAVDAQIELNRPEIERHYPSHTLILFSQKFEDKTQHLYCYIDLFSTFQYYVLLNDNYDGKEVYQSYHQAIAVEEKEPINISKVRPKYLNIVVDEYKIDTSKYKGDSYEEYVAFLQNEVEKYAFNPSLNLKTELYRMLETLMHNYTASKTDLFSSPLIDNLKQVDMKSRMAFIAELNNYFQNTQDGFKSYRKNFYEDDGSGKNVEIMSSPIECLHELTTQEVRQAYCTMKFNQMSRFIFENQEHQQSDD